MLTENIDYSYVYPSTDDSSVHIKILTGEFQDTIFKYGKVGFKEENDEGYLHFDYDVIQSTVMKPKKLEKNENFKNYIGDLLVGIISNRLMENVDESGTTDIEESDL